MPGVGDEHDNGIYNICKKMSREKRIPFEVSIDPFYSDSNMAVIDEAAKQIEQGRVVIKTIDELEAMVDE